MEGALEIMILLNRIDLMTQVSRAIKPENKDNLSIKSNYRPQDGKFQANYCTSI